MRVWQCLHLSTIAYAQCEKMTSFAVCIWNKHYNERINGGISIMRIPHACERINKNLNEIKKKLLQCLYLTQS